MIRTRAVSLGLLAGPPLIWASLIVAGTRAMESLPAVPLTGLSWALATLILVGLSWPHRAALIRALTPRPLWFLIAGACGTTGFQFFWYAGLAAANPIDVALLTAALPLFICLGDRIVYRAPLGIGRSLGLALAVAGALHLSLDGNWAGLATLDFAPGAGAILAADVAMMIYTLMLRRAPDLPAAPLMTGLSLMGLAAFLPIALLLGANPLPIAPAVADPWLLLDLLYIAAAAYVFAYLLWNLSVARHGPSPTGLVLYLQPIFGVLLAHGFLDAPISASQIIGGAAILLGLFIGEWIELRKTKGDDRG